MEDETIPGQFCALMEEMATSMSSVRETIKSLNEERTSYDTRDGISLLSLKHHALLSYINSSIILSSRRAIGHSLSIRSPPTQPFSASDRQRRGSGPGDLVDSMVETRIVLEKIQTLEARMRYQIEKLVRLAQEPEKSLVNADPLAFRPNPQNLVDNFDHQNDGSEDDATRPHSVRQEQNDSSMNDGIYRPPRVAPVPYLIKTKSQLRKERPPVPSALSSLVPDPTRPHIESTSGLGSTPSLASGRAAYLKRLVEFEEENFSRVIMKKSDARRRARDEEDLALGGSLSGGISASRRRAGGLEDEFGDVLKSVERGNSHTGGGRKGDGYDELRNRSKRGNALERSRVQKREAGFGFGDEREVEGRTKKRSRFELETRVATKKSRKSKN